MTNLNELDRKNISEKVSKRLGATRAARQVAEAARRKVEEEEEQQLATEVAQKEAEAARQQLDDNCLIPSSGDFALLNSHFIELAKQIEEALQHVRDIAAQQAALLQRLLEVAENMGKRFKTSVPTFYTPRQLDVLMREFFDTEFALLELSAGLPDAIANYFGISTAKEQIYATARALLLQNAGIAARTSGLLPSNVHGHVLPTRPAPIVPTQPARATPAQPVRTSFSVETWVGECCITGIGATSAEDCFQHYTKCCAVLGVSGITTQTFSSEMADLGVEKKRTNKGNVYFLRIK